MTFADLKKLDGVKNPAVWLLIGVIAVPFAVDSWYSALAKVGLYHPPPVETEPRTMDRKSNELFINLVKTTDENHEILKRQDRLLESLVEAQRDVSSAVKTNAITTGVVAQAIEKGFERVEARVDRHDDAMRARR